MLLLLLLHSCPNSAGGLWTCPPWDASALQPAAADEAVTGTHIWDPHGLPAAPAAASRSATTGHMISSYTDLLLNDTLPQENLLLLEPALQAGVALEGTQRLLDVGRCAGRALVGYTFNHCYTCSYTAQNAHVLWSGES
jgi:hypothetical protein